MPSPFRVLQEPPSHGGRRPSFCPALHPTNPEVGNPQNPGGSLFSSLLFPLLSAPFLPRISLNTLTLNVKSEKVYTRHGVPISVTGIAQVRLSEPSPPKPTPTFSRPLSTSDQGFLSTLPFLWPHLLQPPPRAPSSSSSLYYGCR